MDSHDKVINKLTGTNYKFWLSLIKSDKLNLDNDGYLNNPIIINQHIIHKSNNKPQLGTVHLNDGQILTLTPQVLKLMKHNIEITHEIVYLDDNIQQTTLYFSINNEMLVVKCSPFILSFNDYLIEHIYKFLSSNVNTNIDNIIEGTFTKQDRKCKYSVDVEYCSMGKIPCCGPYRNCTYETIDVTHSFDHTGFTYKQVISLETYY